MLCRIFKSEDHVLNIGDKVRYIYFIKEGAMTLYNRQKKPTIQLQSGSWFGDYHVFFKLKSNVMIRSEPPQSTIREFLEYKIHSHDIEFKAESETFLMCIESGTLKDLCELYPKTA